MKSFQIAIINQMNPLILVTGGAGFIGSHVNKLLHLAGYQTLVIDNLSTGCKKAVTRGTLIECDLSDKEKLEQIFSSYPIDAVMHFAASIDVRESLVSPAKYYNNNVVNTLNLLHVMLKHDVKKLIFSSSAGVYGISESKITEEHPFNPINPYGQTKLIIENILREYDKTYAFKSCSLRYFNAAGGDPDGEVKNFKTKESNLIPILLKSLKNQDTVTIFGTDYPTPDGTCVRDYVHVNDIGSAHLLALKKLLSGGHTDCYNLGLGRGHSILEVIQAVEEVTGHKVNTIFGDRSEGDPPILYTDAEKARRELGWTPEHSKLKTMIEHAWKNLSLNVDKLYKLQ